MEQQRVYHIFISHAWKYGEAYDKLVHLLKMANNFKWTNYSVPANKPILTPDEFGDDELLLKKLEGQIRQASCVLVISGMYINHKRWMQAEIDVACEYNKPIVGIKPRGRKVTPKEVQDAATVMVGWNTISIITAIKNLCPPKGKKVVNDKTTFSKRVSNKLFDNKKK